VRRVVLEWKGREGQREQRQGSETARVRESVYIHKNLKERTGLVSCMLVD
jgi:hypothetical protein